ncbi:protein FAR1-RELATED SEQUENCE [Trifolium repens]|nr:protein FAR1-RELATED SEQUENCE [Trifolium repens]
MWQKKFQWSRFKNKQKRKRKEKKTKNHVNVSSSSSLNIAPSSSLDHSRLFLIATYRYDQFSIRLSIILRRHLILSIPVMFSRRRRNPLSSSPSFSQFQFYGKPTIMSEPLCSSDQPNNNTTIFGQANMNSSSIAAVDCVDEWVNNIHEQNVQHGQENIVNSEPHLEMKFDYEAATYEFYNEYNKRIGFGIRREYANKSKKIEF